MHMTSRGSISSLLLLFVMSIAMVSFIVLHLFQSYQLRMRSLARQDLHQHKVGTRANTINHTNVSATAATEALKQLYSVKIRNYAPRVGFNLSIFTDDVILYHSQIASNQTGRVIPYRHVFNDNSTEEDGMGNYFLYDHNNADPCYVHYISLKYNPRCGHDSTLRPRYIKPLLIVAVQRSGTHYMWEMLQRLGVDVHHEGVGSHGAVSWLYAVNSHGNATEGVYDFGHGYIINNPEALYKNRFRLIFHQVRHPLRVVSTLMRCCAGWDRYWQWIHSLRGFEQIRPQLSPLKRAMLLYLLWNRHIQQYADIRYEFLHCVNIDDNRYRGEITTAWEVCMWAGLQDEVDCFAAYNPVAKQHRPQSVLRSNSSAIELQRASATSTVSGSTVPNAGTQDIVLSTLPSFKANAVRLLSWADLEKEDLALSNELKVMCREYGYPLDPARTPQSMHSRQFTA